MMEILLLKQTTVEGKKIAKDTIVELPKGSRRANTKRKRKTC